LNAFAAAFVATLVALEAKNAANDPPSGTSTAIAIQMGKNAVADGAT